VIARHSQTQWFLHRGEYENIHAVERASPDLSDNTSHWLQWLIAAPLTRRTLGFDTFSQANENPLSSGGNWVSGYVNTFDCNGSMSAMQVVSNTVEASGVNVCDAMQYKAVNPPADQWCQVQIAALNSNFHEGGCVVRASVPPAQWEGYGCHYYRKPNLTTFSSIIFKAINAAPGSATIATDNSQTWAAGDILRCEAQGNEIRLFRNDVLVTAGTDNEFASGYTAMEIYIGAGGAVTDFTLTNFSMGDWTVGSSTGTVTVNETFTKAKQSGNLTADLPWDCYTNCPTDWGIVNNAAAISGAHEEHIRATVSAQVDSMTVQASIIALTASNYTNVGVTAEVPTAGTADTMYICMAARHASEATNSGVILQVWGRN
jgi:hypothetical protein